MGEVDTGEGIGAEVVFAVGSIISLLVLRRVARDVLGLLLLLLLAAEHLIEEAELGLSGANQG